MMCSICHKPIASIFGTDRYPICQSCFLKLKEDDDYHLYLAVCGELPRMDEFEQMLQDYILGNAIYRDMNSELTKLLDSERQTND